MKKSGFWYLILVLTITFSACGGGSSNSGGGEETPIVFTPGDKVTFTADSVSFKMAYVPGKTFPTGINDNGTATVSNAYWIGETEVTYELWKKVNDWATHADRGANIYYFAYPGTNGNSGSGSIQQPVTCINWRDSMIFCNALTEWYNAKNSTSYNCAYYSDSGYTSPIRDSRDGLYGSSINSTAGSFDNPYVKANATGFRLLTTNEWELAARWRNGLTNTVSGYADPYFTKGNSASGAITYNDDNSNGSGEPGKSANDVYAVYGGYWDGSSWLDTGVTGTAEVKSRVNGANSLGLYDMSGNVYEWCFEWTSSPFRVRRGGCWSNDSDKLQVGYKESLYTYYCNVYMGFRFARSNP